MRVPGATPTLLGLACVICAAALAALPGSGASANSSADAATIVSALSLVPKAVTTWEKAAEERQREACARPAILPALGLPPLRNPDKHCRSE